MFYYHTPESLDYSESTPSHPVIKFDHQCLSGIQYVIVYWSIYADL